MAARADWQSRRPWWEVRRGKAALRDWDYDRGVQRLIELAESEDERVATMVALGIWERAFGKPKDYDPREDKPPVKIDLTRLTVEQLVLIRMLIDSGAIRPAPTEPDRTSEERGSGG